MNIMLRVGSSTSIRGSATGLSESAIVSPMSTPAWPTTAMMSPAEASVTSVRPSFSKTKTPSAVPILMALPALMRATLWPFLIRPELIRPMAMRPTYSEKSSVVQRHLERAVGVDLGAGDPLADQVEQGLDVARGRLGVVRGEARAAGGEDVGEVELALVGPEFDEGVEDLVQDLFRPGVGAVDLVDDHDRPELVRKGLPQHELGLRHRAFERVDEHQAAVGELQGPLDLAAEVGVAGGVDDVDLLVAVRDRDVLRENRDPALAFLVIGVQDAIALELAGPELSGLTKHRINERRLAVVDVGDDRYIPNVVASDHKDLDLAPSLAAWTSWDP